MANLQVQEGSKKDMIYVYDMELTYPPMLYINSKEQFQATLNLNKDGIYYTIYIDDWQCLCAVITLDKLDKVSACGYMKVQQEQNVNRYTKFEVKIQAAQIVIGTHLFNLNAEDHNNGVHRLSLLKYGFVNIHDDNRVKTTLTEDEILTEMQSILVSSGLDSTVDKALLKLEQEQIDVTIKAANNKKRNVTDEDVNMFSFVKKSQG
ncbi:hypothetical protein MBANPS3_012575 [Mucor bainieri]